MTSLFRGTHDADLNGCARLADLVSNALSRHNFVRSPRAFVRCCPNSRISIRRNAAFQLHPRRLCATNAPQTRPVHQRRGERVRARAHLRRRRRLSGARRRAAKWCDRKMAFVCATPFAILPRAATRARALTRHLLCRVVASEIYALVLNRAVHGASGGGARGTQRCDAICAVVLSTRSRAPPAARAACPAPT